MRKRERRPNASGCCLGQEERAYLTWWASRPTEDVTVGRDFFEGQYQLFQSSKALQDRHLSPTDAQVQALVEQWRTLAHRYRARESVLAMLDWNATIARKVMDAGARAVERDLSAGQGTEPSAGDTWRRFGTSAHGRDRPGHLRVAGSSPALERTWIARE